MEINITSFFTSDDTWNVSGSNATHGQDAAKSTWAEAQRVAADAPLLADDAACQYFRDYCKDFGAWDDEERAAWTPVDCNALLLQMIAGDMRESGLDGVEVDGDDDKWAEYEDGAREGTYPSAIYRQAGAVYYSLEH